jgi:hypothetical protein
MLRFTVVTVLFLFACLSAPNARAEGVATCGLASAEGQGMFSCSSSWSYRTTAEITATTLVLTCRQQLTPGPQNMADCAYAAQTRYVRRSALTGSELVGYCAQAVHSPWEACDYPSGKEGWRLASDAFGTSASPPPPPSATPDSPTSVTISWSPVTSSTDGTAAAISSYRIEYGQGNFATAASTTASSITFSSLASGTWQFRVIAVSSGGSSAPSTPVTRVIGSSSTTTSPPPASPPVAASWLVAPSGSSSTRTVYEAVLPSAGTALVRGNSEGTISVGRTCGAEVFKIGTDSYRDVIEGEVTLASPSYGGRRHVAVCRQQT